MAILFNEKEYEKLIIKKGEEYGDPVLLEVELEQLYTVLFPFLTTCNKII